MPRFFPSSGPNDFTARLPPGSPGADQRMVAQPYADPGYGMPNAFVGNLNQAPGLVVGGALRANALQPVDPNAANPLAQAPSWADAAQSVAGTVSSGVDALGQWLAAQRAKSAQRGLWNDQTGLPTGKGLVSAAQQYGNALMMGTTAPGDAPGFSLEKVQRRPLAPPNEHIWKIKDPAGADAGTIDTTWNPDTGNLHIEDFQSEGGPNTLGATAIRQLRSALLEQYPGVQSLSGLRISGATYAHRNSGAGPGRYASQTVE